MVKDRHTHGQTDYCNPPAHAQRVNNNSTHVRLNEHAPYKRGVARPEKWHSQKYKTNIQWPRIQGQQILPPNTAYTYTVCVSMYVL